MTNAKMERVLRTLERESKHWDVPIVTLVANTGHSPFRVLVSCILSLRTKDETTADAVRRLFAAAHEPGALAELSVERIEELIYPVGFYRNKAAQLGVIATRIRDELGGKVPSTIEELMEFKGVGRKTANLVVAEGFGKPAICVDVHVHRITNRLGYLKSRNPEETEFALRKKLPLRWWRKINAILVAFGQGICRPVSPHCSSCSVRALCRRVGVQKSR